MKTNRLPGVKGNQRLRPLDSALSNTLASISARFVSASSCDVDDAMQHALQQLGAFFGADRSYLFCFSDDLQRMRNTHEWCAPDVAEEKDGRQDLATGTFPWWMKTIRRMQPVRIPDVSALPPEAGAEMRAFQDEGVRSKICLPVRTADGGLLGFMGLDFVRKSQEWSDHEVDMLQVAADIISNVMARRGGHVAMREDSERRVAERADERRRANADLQTEKAERGRVETALRDSEDRYWRIMQATRSFVYTEWDDGERETRTVHEPDVSAVTGYTADEFAQDAELWRRIIYPDDAVAVEQHVQSVHDGRPVPSIEYRILHKDGRIRWIRDTLVGRTRPDGAWAGCDGLVTDITTLKLAEVERDKLLDSLRRMASHDCMTGLLNRRGLNEELQRIWNLALRHPFSIGLLVADIDHFKSINDTHGHAAGDLVIKEYADLVHSLVRDADVVCRYAGDELVVILPWADMHETRRVGERLLEVVRDHVFCQGEHDLTFTVSVGGFARIPRISHCMERFLNLADRALYRAKQGGRDCLRIVDEEQLTAHTEGEGGVLESGWAEADADEKARALVVEDDPHMRKVFELMLAEDHIRVMGAANAEEALQIAQREQGMIDVALVDLFLGADNGLELIRQLQEVDDLIVPVVVTGAASMDAAIDALRGGAFDFISKPIELSKLLVHMRRAILHRRVLRENRRYRNHLEEMVSKKGEALSKALEKEKESHQFALEAMAALLSARERRTGEHCQRVARMTVVLASELGVPEDEMGPIRNGALLHDIGKIAIPDSILLKPAPLTDEEWKVIETHPQIGCRIIASSPMLKEAAEIVLSHQEKYDGSGYPRGLAANRICLGARIFAVVDAYDAMRSERPYSKSMAASEAIKEIVRQSGAQFDPYVVQAFLRCQNQLEAEGEWDD